VCVCVLYTVRAARAFANLCGNDHESPVASTHHTAAAAAATATLMLIIIMYYVVAMPATDSPTIMLWCVCVCVLLLRSATIPQCVKLARLGRIVVRSNYMFINNERVRATSFPRVAIMENRFEMSPLPLLCCVAAFRAHFFFWRRAR
jgi:hypothetical protein